MTRLLAVLGVLVSAFAAGGTEPASTRDTQVDVDEECSFRLLPGSGLVLTSSMVISNARGGQSASVRVTPGWNVGRLYPKSESSLLVPLTAGYTARRTASRRFPDAPQLRKMLQSGTGLVCASSYTVRIPASVAP